MQVPNADHAIVAPEKIVRYLLVPEHPQNQGKAAFFFRFGFYTGAMGLARRRALGVYPCA